MLGRLAAFAMWVGFWWAQSEPPNLLLGAGVALLDFLILMIQASYAISTNHRFQNTLWSALIWLSLIVTMAVSFINISNQMSRAAAAPPAPPFSQATLRIDGTTAFISGDIDFETFEALKATLQQSTNIQTLELNSTGGRIPAARGLALLVEETALNTRVEGTCASACTLVFIAGKKRHLGPHGKLGFHGYRLLSGIATLNPQEEQSRDRAYFEARQVPSEFLDRAFETPADQMWFPSRSELIASGVLSEE